VLAVLITTTGSATAWDLGVGNVFGADVIAGCKKPCNDITLMARQECLDPCNYFKEDDEECTDDEKTPNGCNKNYCTINNYHLFICDPGDPASDAGKCEYHDVNTDWYRSSLVRQMPCTDRCVGPTPDPNCDVTLPPCQYAGPKRGFSTPCWSNECWGELKADNINKPGRRLCGPAPPPPPPAPIPVPGP